MWGRLTYNPQAKPDVWEHEFTQRFGAEAGPHVMNGLHLASQVLPRIVAASYRYQNFPTTRGWAEMNRQGSLPRYAGEDGSDIQQFMNVRDEAKSILQGYGYRDAPPGGNQPLVCADRGLILAEVARAEAAIGSSRRKRVHDRR